MPNSPQRPLGRNTLSTRLLFMVILLSGYSYFTSFVTINYVSSDLLKTFKGREHADHPNMMLKQERGRMVLLRNISGHCWRACPQRINKIYFKHGRAGLGDRLTVMDNLAQIAGYLCAILEMPPPSEMLHPKHNNGNLVSEKLKWLDFRNLTFLQDGSQVVRGLDTTISDDLMTGSQNFPGWLHIISTDSGSSKDGLLEDFIRLQEFSLLQGTDAKTGFIWEIHSTFYESNLFDRLLPPPSSQVQELLSGYEDQMLPELPTYFHFHPEEKQKQNERCTYTNNDHMQLQPTSMAWLRETLRERVRMNGLNNSIYGFLHIRRGDSLDGCDSRIEVIDHFLKCSLNGTEAQGKNITLLLGSDETNTTYREEVMKLVQDGFPHVSILDADFLTVEVIKEAVTSGLIAANAGFESNNYYIYEVQRTLRRGYSFSSVFLDKHRTNCKTCTRLMDHFPSVWKNRRDRKKGNQETYNSKSIKL